MKAIESELMVTVEHDKAYFTAIEELFKTLYKPLCNYAYSFLQDVEESEDVVQGIFYNLWKNRDRMEMISSVKSYLFVAVRNNCLKKIHQLKIRDQHKENILYNSEKSYNSTMEKVTSKE